MCVPGAIHSFLTIGAARGRDGDDHVGAAHDLLEVGGGLDLEARILRLLLP